MPASGREVRRVVKARDVLEGAGVVVTRAIPSPEVSYQETDPFLLLDDFDSSRIDIEGQAFPRHPHRGFEIITYLLSGLAGHADDLGNESVVRGGGLQRITAGSGIWHEEGPTPDAEEPTRGLQLWINLARRDKGTDPEYQPVQPEEIPVVEEGDATVRVLVGEGSPTRLITPAVYLDVTLPAKGIYETEAPAAYRGFAYVLEGDGSFGSNHASAERGDLLVLPSGEGFRTEAGPEGVRFVVGLGQPHREPIRWMGPFVD